MTSAQDRPRRRRRAGRPGADQAGQPAASVRDPAAQPGAAVTDPAAPVRSAAPARSAAGPAARPGNTGTGRRDEPGRGHGRDSERGWRELTGNAPSQVGFSGALRARDVARPTEADLADAERTVVVVRRQWQPPQT